MTDYHNELETAREIARVAGRAILDFYAQPEEHLRHKGVDDPQTAADRAANTLILAELARAFPDDAIIGEESADLFVHPGTLTRLWLVDPLDGTKEFLDQNGQFVVQIGLVVEGRPRVGVVYQPTADRFDLAIVGEGAWRQVGDGPRAPLRVRQVADPARMIAVMSRSHPTPAATAMLEALAPGEMRPLGSAGLKFGAIAAGEADLSFHATSAIKLWDSAAPEAVLVAAGGAVSDLTGIPLAYDPARLRHPDGMLISNGAAHDRLVATLAPLWAAHR